MTRRQTYYLIGVDGGGTGCRAALCAADGKILGQGAGGPANATTDLAQAIYSVKTAIRAACGEAGCDASVLGAATGHIGLAGVLGAQAADTIAAAMPMARITVTDDRVTSVAGALGERDGALVAIGTGTIIAARRDGAVRHIGGWGLQISDQASGAWLGRGLLERVLLCHDGMAEHSPLTRATLADFAEGPRGIVAFAVGARPSDYAAHVPGIVAMAVAGDPVGQALMQEGAGYLERALTVLGVGGSDILCLAGGLGPLYAAWLTEARRAMLHPAAGSALDGAVALALRSHKDAVLDG